MSSQERRAEIERGARDAGTASVIPVNPGGDRPPEFGSERRRR